MRRGSGWSRLRLRNDQVGKAPAPGLDALQRPATIEHPAVQRCRSR